MYQSEDERISSSPGGRSSPPPSSDNETAPLPSGRQSSAARSTVEEEPSAAQALEGLRVVELGEFIPAAYASKLLADLGADVVTVESPAGDRLRRQGPFPADRPDLETGALHLFLNTNKRSTTADLDHPGGRERVIALARDADIVVTDLPPSRIDALGLGYDELAAGRRDLVMVSITPFGLDTPRRDWRGPALVTTAASGLMNRIGDPGREPLWLPFCAADFQGGVHAAAAALAAVRARRLTGQGQHAWISTAEILSTVMGGGGLPAYVFNGQLRRRAGFHNDGFYPWQVAPAADGFVDVITMVDDHWRRFVRLMGDPAWAADPRLDDRWLTFQWADEIDAHWHPWLAARTREELSSIFAEHRLPFQPVNTIDEVVRSPHLEQRGLWQDTQHPVVGPYRTLGAPYRLSATPWRLSRPAPQLGEHNEDLATELTNRAPAAGSQEPHHTARAGTNDRGRAAPMTGLRVLDHGHVWAGPLLAGLLADYGAEVIKVQAPTPASGIAMGGRTSLGVAGDAAQGDPRKFHGWDRGKLGITLNLASAEGRSIYLQLVRQSDIVVENFAPRVMPSLGLPYRVLAQANPRIIMASLSATGATEGPWRDLLTYGPSLSALYGIKSLQGYRDDPRPREDTADLDPTAAAHGFVAICAALEYRERSGRGQHIDLAQGEATIQRIAEPVLDYLLNGRVASTQGNRYPGVAPHGVYPTASDDRWIAIVAEDQTAWEALVSLAAAAAPTIADQRFETLAGRLEHQDELDEAIAQWTRQHEAHALAETLQSARVAASPVMDPPQILLDENFAALRQRHVRLETGHSLTADAIYQSPPWKLPATPGVVRLPTPTLGEHNEEVFGRLLGLDASDLAGLRERGAI